MKKYLLVFCACIIALTATACSQETKTETDVETLAPKYSEKDVYHPDGNAVNPPDPSSKVVHTDKVTIFLDNKNWKEQTLTSGKAYTVDGKPIAQAHEIFYVEEVLGTPFTELQPSQMDSLLTNSLKNLALSKKISWKKISSDENDFVASIEGSGMSGYLRVFGNSTDYVVISYIKQGTLSDEEKATWKDLIMQTNLKDTSTDAQG